MSHIDALRPLTAGRLLAIWHESCAAEEDPAARGLISNAAVLAECCFLQGRRVFDGPEAVLEALTVDEMEGLLRRLAAGAEPPAPHPAAGNPAFDTARFRELGGGEA